LHEKGGRIIFHPHLNVIGLTLEKETTSAK
jgi:hypothetical protein